jgi:hypothetical protein
MAGAVRILVGQHADEFPVPVEIVEREVDQPGHGVARRQRGEIQFPLARPDVGIGRLERRPVEVVLAAEIIVDKLLVDLGPAGDLVDARPFQAALGELDAGCGQDGAACRLGVASVPALRLGEDFCRKRYGLVRSVRMLGQFARSMRPRR